MKSIGFYCDASRIEQNALEQLQQYAGRPFIEHINAYPDIHYCQEKALPVGVAFVTKGWCYPLITGKDIGCGVMYLRIEKADWLKPFDKSKHYTALQFAQQQMTDEGLGGGNHFLSVEEDDSHVYIICHTGTRNRGIALYQECVSLTRNYEREAGTPSDCVPQEYLPEAFCNYYNAALEYGYARRKTFCFKTLAFLQQAGYIRYRRQEMKEGYLKHNYLPLPEHGSLHGTEYQLEDTVHNHLRFNNGQVIHRKGSTEILPGKTVVIHKPGR